MKLSCKLLIAFTFALTPVLLLAQEKDSGKQVIDLDIDTAVSYAMDSNVDIKREEISLEQAKRSSDHSWNSLLPSASASSSFSDSGSSLTSSSSSQTLSTSLSASLTVDGSLGLKIKSLKAAYQSGLKDYEDTLRDVECEVRKSYYSLIYQKLQVELYESNVTSYENLYDQAKIKKGRGLIPELDLLTAEVNLENARVTLKKSQASYYSSLLEFMNDIGIDGNSYEVNLTGSLDDCDLAGDVNSLELYSAVLKSPSVRGLNDSLYSAELSEKQTAASAYSPDLTLSASVNPYSYSFSSREDSSSWSVSAGISINLDNYLPGSSASDSIKSAKDTVKDYELQRNDKIKSVMTEAVTKINDIEICKENLEALSLNVELALKTSQMTEEAYEKGTKDMTSLQSAMDSYESTVLEWRSGQYTLLSDILDLENLLGLDSKELFNISTEDKE